MTIPTSDAPRRRIVESAKNPTKLRLAALREMVRPSVAFLIRLEKDPALPHKLMIEVVRRREAETQVRRIVRKSDNAAPLTGHLSREAGSVPHGQEAALQQISEDSRRLPTDREAARKQLGRSQKTAFDDELEALLEGRSKRSDAAPHIQQVYNDLRYPTVFDLLGGFPNFDYHGYFDRLTELHAETCSEMVRAKAEQAIAHFAQARNPETKTLASEALNRLHHVAGTCPNKGE